MVICIAQVARASLSCDDRFARPFGNQPESMPFANHQTPDRLRRLRGPGIDVVPFRRHSR